MACARDQNHDDYIGTCEGCSKLLFVGDKGFTYDDGPVVCEGCAPDWDQAKENWDAQKSENPEDYAAFVDALAHHLANGGKSSDQIIKTL